jgi:hypothetical protein
MANSKLDLDVEYDFVAIIDTLPPAERAKWQISDRLMSFLAKHGIEQIRAECDTPDQLRKALNHFAELARSGKRFCLHIISHGNKEGLYLKSVRQVVAWKELTAHLQSINEAMHDGLVVNMTSCFGLHGVKIVDTAQGQLPFFGLIGANRKITAREAISLNESYYTKLLAGEPIQRIVPMVNTEKGEDTLYNITGTGYRQLRAVKRRTPESTT